MVGNLELNLWLAGCPGLVEWGLEPRAAMSGSVYVLDHAVCLLCRLSSRKCKKCKKAHRSLRENTTACDPVRQRHHRGFHQGLL